MIFLILKFSLTLTPLAALIYCCNISSISDRLLLIRTISSANPKWFRLQLSILIPVLSKLKVLNRYWIVNLTHFRDMLSPCRTPILIATLLLFKSWAILICRKAILYMVGIRLKYYCRLIHGPFIRMLLFLPCQKPFKNR